MTRANNSFLVGFQGSGNKVELENGITSEAPF